MSEFRKVITKPGEVIPFGTVFEENPLLRTGVPERMGTVERIEYDTDVYENGKTYHKYAYAYLPWCYDPEDKAAVCTVHTADSTVESSEENSENTEPTEETPEPTEESSEPATEPPTDPPDEPTDGPDLFLPPQQEDDWYRRKTIV